MAIPRLSVTISFIYRYFIFCDPICYGILEQIIHRTIQAVSAYKPICIPPCFTEEKSIGIFFFYCSSKMFKEFCWHFICHI